MPEIRIPLGRIELEGQASLAEKARGIVLFAHGSGSSRTSPRNQAVARTLNDAGITTLLFDLLSAEEEASDRAEANFRFDVAFLAERLINATHFVKRAPIISNLNVGYFGASTGGAAALIAAARLPEVIHAVVSRGGRPDLAGTELPNVRAPTLLIVGGADDAVLELNRSAYAKLACEKELAIVPGATHLFDEAGALDEVARLAAEWFRRHLDKDAR